MIKLIDSLLDRITMYRLVLYYLIALLIVAVGLSLAGVLHYDALGIIFSAGILTLTCWVTNKVFARVFEAPTNIESVYITALILALIITPIRSVHEAIFPIAAAGLAMSSKYILAIRKKLIFNPTAIAVALTAIGAGQAASWWVGSSVMLPFVLAGGLLVVWKIQRESLVISFFVATFAATLAISIVTGGNIMASLQKTLLESSLFFFGFIMLTEPSTTPPTARKQIVYGALIGLLFPPQIHLGSIYSTPELALVVGNVFSYIVSPKLKLIPKLATKVNLAPDIEDFIFIPERPLSFRPGQYMEWTLPHSGADSRGNRRYFTLASSPTEHNLRLGIKFYPNGSSFKRAMLALDSTTLIAAAGLGGDFVLPKNPTQKLAFIAGGIGVTPFRSMIKYLTDTNDRRTVTLLYAEKSRSELVYTDVFEQARQILDIKTVYTVSDDTGSTDPRIRSGLITADVIKAEIPDYADRLFYISGSQPMVSSMKNLLHGMGVSNNQIKTDFFPGYA